MFSALDRACMGLRQRLSGEGQCELNGLHGPTEDVMSRTHEVCSWRILQAIAPRVHADDRGPLLAVEGNLVPPLIQDAQLLLPPLLRLVDVISLAIAVRLVQDRSTILGARQVTGEKANEVFVVQSHAKTIKRRHYTSLHANSPVPSWSSRTTGTRAMPGCTLLKEGAWSVVTLMQPGNGARSTEHDQQSLTPQAASS